MDHETIPLMSDRGEQNQVNAVGSRKEPRVMDVGCSEGDPGVESADKYIRGHEMLPTHAEESRDLCKGMTSVHGGCEESVWMLCRVAYHPLRANTAVRRR